MKFPTNVQFFVPMVTVSNPKAPLYVVNLDSDGVEVVRVYDKDSNLVVETEPGGNHFATNLALALTEEGYPAQVVPQPPDPDAPGTPRGERSYQDGLTLDELIAHLQEIREKSPLKGNTMTFICVPGYEYHPLHEAKLADTDAGDEHNPSATVLLFSDTLDQIIQEIPE